MKMIVAVALALMAVASALPVQDDIEILHSDVQLQPDGGYDFSFEASNGITRKENGQLKDALDEENKSHSVVVVRGSYAYPGEDGKPVSITYYADETGYHAEGESIPKPASRR